MKVVSTVFTIKGKAKDVFAEIAELAKAEPKKTIKQIWLDNKKN